MIHGVKIDGQFLDLHKDPSFDFQLQSPAYFGGTSDVIQNSLVFTVKVPNTSRNAKLLKHAHLASNASNFLARKYAELWADGGLLFDGQLTVDEASKTDIGFRILINAAGELKNLLMKDIDLHTAVNLGASPLGYAKATTTAPLDHDFIFFPVYNENFETKETTLLVNPFRFQNFYDIATQNFTADSPITPFLRFDYILKAMFETIGFTLVNRFQTTDEMKRLVLYNNYDARKNGAFPDTLNLKNHVPQELKCGEFVNKLCRLFNIAPFIDGFGKSAELYPLSNAIKEAAAYDWSDKMLTGWTLRQEALEVPKRIGYKDYLKHSGSTYRYEQDFDAIPHTPIADVQTLTHTSPEGVYYEYTSGTYFSVEIFGTEVRISELTRQISPLKSTTAKGAGFYNDLIAPLNERVFIRLNNLEMGDMPWVKVEGSNATKTTEPPLVVMAYRGMHPSEMTNNGASQGGSYPFASLRVYNTLHQRCGVDSFGLHFDGEFGLGENCIGDWYSILQNKKDLTARFNLTVAELRNFSFRKKVHINGMDFFVKTIKGKITAKGLLPVEADLCTAIF